MFKNMKLSTKLLVAFLCVGLIPFAVVGLLSLTNASNALSNQAFNQLKGVREIKKTQIEKFFGERKGDMGVLMETVNTLRDEAFSKLTALQTIKRSQIEGYFGERLGDVSVLSKNDTVITALEEFNSAFMGEGKKAGGSTWSGVENEYASWLKQYQNEYGYYDLFLITNIGNVVYTVSKESDLGKNLINGSLKDSPLGKLFQKARNSVAVQDFEPYAPSNNEPAAFVGAPVKRNGRTIGVVVLQLSIDAINKIMQERTGMGKTGETYLVGPDKLMRSDSFLDPTNHSLKASFANPTKGSVDTEASREALAGKAGADVIMDYNGNPVLSAYAPLNIQGLKWAIIAEIDVAEAFCPVDEKGNYYYEKYIEQYGYYDLFLINPDGYVFYTATKEADYQTNMLNGKYSSSNLGKLVRQVSNSSQYGLADFAPYAPSNNEPCAFIAQPVKHNGDVEIIVALQLSLEAINEIMQQREGMGKTGETYLIGSDKLMRSDSFLDPSNHSVKASFANPNQGNVNTEASQEALSGKTDAKIIIDYNGNPVLSAYTPLKVGDTTWALLAEIDESEAFAAVNSIKWLIFIVAIIGIAAILAVAILIARSITLPINRIIDNLSEGSGQVTSASGQISTSSQQLAAGSTEQAASLEETSASLEQTSTMTQKNAENAVTANKLSSKSMEAGENGREAMDELLKAMSEINASSQKISQIIKVIEEIAFQTNLLALNAAVEAARAGEAGKGFAVVAEEVRNLAQRSATAAKDTAALIEESVHNAEAGNSVATRAGDVLKDILDNVSQAATLIEEIASASKEQAEGIKQINTAVAQMDEVTQQNAASAEENASASEQLSAQAENLNDIVSELAQIVGKEVQMDSVAARPVKRMERHHFDFKKPKTLNAPQKVRTIEYTKAKEVKPNEVIPMGDEDFKDF